MKMKLLLTILFAISSQLLWAAVGISGKIVNEKNEPMGAVTAYLINSTNDIILKTAITKEDGHYAFENVAAGSYYVEARMIGYSVSRSAVIAFNKTQQQLADLKLSPSTNALAEVTIEGKRPLVENKQGKLILNVENSPLAAGNNGLDIVQRAPGVSLDNDNNLQLMGQSGVKVTIDGRQTYMTGEQLTTLLKSTDGNQIKSVEVIKSRSARDDAEGAVGTINIVMKKNKMEGFNGNFSATAGLGQKFRGNSALSLNYKKNNTTYFGSYSYSDDKYVNRLNIERIISNDGIETLFDQKSNLHIKDRTHTYKFGIEQKTSDRNVMSLQFNGSNNVELNDNDSKSLIGPLTTIDSTLISLTQFKEGFNRYSLNFNNEFKIDSTGKKLVLDLDWSKFKNSKKADYDNRLFNQNDQLIRDPELLRSEMPIGIDIYVAKLDYNQPLNKTSNIETGVKYSNVKSDNNLLFEEQLDNVWTNIVNRSNHFVYKEQIAAGYFDYDNQLGKWGIKAGLRGEYTMSDGHSITENKQVKRNYFDLFPSANLSYDAHENHIFSLGYSRKITRPNYRQLNPFDYFIDKYTSERGNPYLNPQYANELNLNYTLYKKYTVTFGYNAQTDAIVESMGQDSIKKTTWVTRENLGKNNSAFLNLSMPVQIAKFWSSNNNITAVYMNFDGAIAGAVVNNSSFLFQVNSMSTFKLSPSLSAEMNLRYFSPFTYNIYKLESRWDAQIGFTKNFKDKRSSLKLAVSDVFNTSNQNLSTNFSSFNTKIRQNQDRRVARLTYSYKFGNLKNVTKKKSTDNEEKQRAQ